MTTAIDPVLLAAARDAPGFLPDDEGEALYAAAVAAGVLGPLLEIGSYCGKSAVYLGAAARVTRSVLISVDHHRGSEEHQPGWGYHDPALVDPVVGRVETLPVFRRTIAGAGLEDVVIAVVARAEALARLWQAPLGLVFLDGSHTEESAGRDYECWAPHVIAGGLLAIHDVYLDPAAGGQAPRHVYERALASTGFRERSATGSLRVLERVAPGW